MSAGGFARKGTEVVHEGFLVQLIKATVTVPDGSTVTREIVCHPGAVGVVAVDGAGDVVMERQYRAALDAELLEIPAGKRDVPGEAPLVTAQRELVEEVGLKAGNWTELASFHNSPGFTDEHTTLFLATDLVDVPANVQGPEEEAMEIVKVPLASVWDLVASGDLVDAKSILGLVLGLHRLEG